MLGGLLPANANTNLDEDENAADYFEINTIGTIRVLEYCRKNGIKKVLFTTSYADVQNSWEAGTFLTEEEPRSYRFIGDHAVYVFSKNAASDVLEYYNQQHGMKNVWFRLPPVYGVGPHGSLFVNGKYLKSGLQIFMEKATKGEPICVFGDPNLSRDVVYVKDVAHAIFMAMESDNAKGMYNMTSGRGVTIEEQAKIIADVFAEGKKSIVEYAPEKNNNTTSFLFSMEKANRDFGFVPEYGDFRKMMEDFKLDMDNGYLKDFFEYASL